MTPAPGDAHALGVDAAGKHGWVSVLVGEQGFVAADVAPTVAELIAAAEGIAAAQPGTSGRLAAVGVDIPIGLVDGPVRSADVAARKYVKPRHSSVFAAPHPSVIGLTDYAEVLAVLAAQGLPGLSKQAFGLFPSIREVAEVARDDERVVEVFPEASFRAMTGDPLRWSKKTWNGAAQRRALLASARPAIVLPDELGPAGRVPAHDVLDAAAAAWSAWRYAHGTATAHGDPEELDPVTGRRIAMWT